MLRSSRWMVLSAVGLFACGGTPGESTGSSDSDVTSCASGQTVEGIDVSKWDGTIDWNQVKKSGRAFAFVRVSDGLNYPDSTFAANWAGAKGAGIHRGAYQYFEANQNATSQANLVLSKLGSDPGELPVVVDVEVTDGESAATIRSAIDTWSSVIEKGTGRAPVVYVSPGFWPSVGGKAEADGLWVANWGVSCPSLPSAWSGWQFWQYSDTGSVPGISGQVDLNRFNGSLAQLDAYANVGGGGGSSSSGSSSSSSGGGSSGGSSSSSSSGGSSSGSSSSSSSSGGGSGGSSGSSSGGCSGSVPAGDIARSDVIANAEQWVTAQLAYCQSPEGEPDPDSSCSSTCNRTSNAAWDPYRSDCSGFVSWAWQLPAPGLVTDQFAPFDTSASTTIDCVDMQPGDAANRNSVGHIVLFKEWVTPGSEAVFIEEPGCSSSMPYAHEFTSTVTCSGVDVNIAYEGATFTAIRYDHIADDPCGGSSSGSSSSSSSSSSGSSGGSSSSSGGGAACTSDGQCNPGTDGSGLICVGGHCVPGCNASWECPGATTCVSGQCQ
ncbi:MAG: glycoside hydrolase family 25 protein [Polyangiaceae bacterium]